MVSSRRSTSPMPVTSTTPVSRMMRSATSTPSRARKSTTPAPDRRVALVLAEQEEEALGGVDAHEFGEGLTNFALGHHHGHRAVGASGGRADRIAPAGQLNPAVELAVDGRRSRGFRWRQGRKAGVGQPHVDRFGRDVLAGVEMDRAGQMTLRQDEIERGDIEDAFFEGHRHAERAHGDRAGLDRGGAEFHAGVHGAHAGDVEVSVREDAVLGGELGRDDFLLRRQ